MRSPVVDLARVVRVPGFNVGGHIQEPLVACDVDGRVPFDGEVFNLTMLTRSDGQRRFLCPTHLPQELPS